MEKARRRATAAEIIEARGIDIRQGWRVMFRHPAVESYTDNGIRYKEFNRSRIRVIDGKPLVMCHGTLRELTADIRPGSRMVSDLRIK